MRPIPAADILPLAKRTWAAWSQDKCARLAAALALYTMLSLAPLLVITIKIAAVALGDEAATNQVKTGAQQYVGPAAGQALQDMIAKASQPGEGRWATFLSTVLLVVGATALFASIQDALNTIWGVKPRPGQGIRAMLRVRLSSLLLVLAAAALLLASVVLSNVLHRLGDNDGGGGSRAVVAIGYGFDLLLSIAVTTALFALLFKFLPDVRLDWPEVWLGAFVTAVLFAFGKYALALYFRWAAPASAFGAAGSLAALLLWVYYSGMIAFFGAEFTKVRFLSRGKRITPLPHAVLLTPADRATEGIPTDAQLDAAVKQENEGQRDETVEARADRPSARASPHIDVPPRPRRGFHPASAALGALAGGVLAWWMGRDRSR